MTLDLWTVYRAVLKRKWAPPLGVIITVSAALIIYYLLPTYFEATVLMIPSERVMRQSITENDQMIQPDMEQRDQWISTLVGMAGSRAVAERTAARLHSSASAEALGQRLKVERVSDPQAGRQTILLQLKATAPTGQEAVNQANAAAVSFSEIYDMVSHSEATSSRKFLESQLKVAQAKLDEAESQLRVFRGDNGITSITSQEESAVQALSSLRAERDTTAARLSETIGQLAVVSRQLSETPKTSRNVESTSEGSAAALLKTQINDMEKELSLLRSRYTPEHPKVVDLETTLLRARKQLALLGDRMTQKESVTSNPDYASALDAKRKLDADRSALTARLAALDKAITNHQADMQKFTGTDVDLSNRLLNYTNAQQTYSAILQKLNQARMSESMTTETGAIQIIDRADKAQGPLRNSPNFAQLLISSILLGAISLVAQWMIMSHLSVRQRMKATFLLVSLSPMDREIQTYGTVRCSLAYKNPFVPYF